MIQVYEQLTWMFCTLSTWLPDALTLPCPVTCMVAVVLRGTGHRRATQSPLLFVTDGMLRSRPCRPETKQIARKVGVAPLTVKKRLEYIYRKLGVPNRTPAAALAFDSLTIT